MTVSDVTGKINAAIAAGTFTIVSAAPAGAQPVSIVTGQLFYTDTGTVNYVLTEVDGEGDPNIPGT